jgi:hypothetical protein
MTKTSPPASRPKHRGNYRPVTFQARAAEELAGLPEEAMIAEMLSDYAVMRDEARVCTGP